DTQPRIWSAEARENLRDLADAVMTEIELRIAAVTARQQSEEAAQERDKNAALLASTAEGLYGMDRNGLCTFLNPAASRLIGYSASEALGQNMHDLIHHHRPDGTPYPQEECPIFQAMRAGQPMRLMDEVLWRREGTSFAAEYSAAPLGLDGAGGAVVAFRDITERKQAEAMLRAARQRDQHIAETLQGALIRDISSERYGPIQVASFYQAAWSEAQVGGDFFDVFPLDEDRLAVVVGDASGKGLTAAVRTAEVKFALRAFLWEYPQPAVALARVNDYVCDTQRLEGRPDDAFVSLALAVIEITNNVAVFAVAGAEPPLILRPDGTTEAISARGVPLGVFPRQDYESLSLPFGAGDTLLIATDGLTEARAGSNFLGYEGLTRLALDSAASSDTLNKMGQSIMDGTREFAQGPLHDDACLLLVRRA
ncbi:MAG: SpoIIE family protein phosphatase, partial [Armatimonadota bacterium]|nr:SpoIIE family protein phosphatase [Armatimonadota bacterium]